MHCLMELSGGVVQNTSNRRRLSGRTKMLQKAPLWRSFLFAERENAMDLLQRCAQVFMQLMVGQTQYTLLRKEKIFLKTGERVLQHDRLSHSTK